MEMHARFRMANRGNGRDFQRRSRFSHRRGSNGSLWGKGGGVEGSSALRLRLRRRGAATSAGLSSGTGITAEGAESAVASAAGGDNSGTGSGITSAKEVS
jgi:hypothetical protein